MSVPARDEFDDVPEGGPRQGAHRAEPAAARVGAGELTAIVLAGALTLGVGAWAAGPGLGAAGPAAPRPAATGPAAP